LRKHNIVDGIVLYSAFISDCLFKRQHVCFYSCFR